MSGITRIDIIDTHKGRGADRFKESRKRWDMANHLYQFIAAAKGMALKTGYEVIRCTKEEAKSNYDLELGIDVILSFENGMDITMQEKFLYTNYQTVTVEYMNNPDTEEPGDWFNLRANWYFVGYDTDKKMRWNRWILLNWPATKQLTMLKKIAWWENRNKTDGARASFKYAHMDMFPKECVVAYSNWIEFSNYPKTIGDNGQIVMGF